jgi:tetratricopeptide (TPR) repeat protein
LHAAFANLSAEMESNLLDRARKDPTRAPLILEALAEGYTRTYRVLEAGTCLDRWLALQPDHVQAIYLRGNLWLHMSRLQKAIPEFRRVLELDPKRDDARSWLSAALLQTGRFEEALTHLDRLRASRPKDIDLEVRRARYDKSLGNLDEARRILETVLAEKADHGLALRTRAELEQLAGNLAEAETWYSGAARALPHDYKTQWALYKFLLQERKTKEAKELQRHVDQIKDAMDKMELVRSRSSSIGGAVRARLDRLKNR